MYRPYSAPPTDDVYSRVNVKMEDGTAEEHSIHGILSKECIVFGIDLGTTYSSVAYARLREGDSTGPIHPSRIKFIRNYPGDPSGMLGPREQVPTELSYSCESDTKKLRRGKNGFCRDVITSGSTPLLKRSWGYEAQQQSNKTTLRGNRIPLKRFKFSENFDETKTTLEAMRKEKIIHRNTDVYIHYLTELLEHTKAQLLKTRELTAQAILKFVLCVPASWTMYDSNVMQCALEKAVAKTGMSNRTHCSVHCISESEAAVKCIMAERPSGLYRDERVVIVDAGGGTVNATTYRCVEESDPDPDPDPDSDSLLLEVEGVDPSTLVCGGSLINDRFEEILRAKLCGEDYLFNDGKSLEDILEASISVFENYEKRYFDISKGPALSTNVYINGLKKNEEKGFHENFVVFKHETMRQVFEPSTLGGIEVVEGQLQLAESNKYRVQEVILIGGLPRCPSFLSGLKTHLNGRRNIKGWNIVLSTHKNSSTVVARGAVYWAVKSLTNTNCL